MPSSLRRQELRDGEYGALAPVKVPTALEFTLERVWCGGHGLLGTLKRELQQSPTLRLSHETAPLQGCVPHPTKKFVKSF